MSLRLTVLGGASGGIPLGSGILLETAEGRRLVDCGNGIVGALVALEARRRADAPGASAIEVTRSALDVVDVLLTHLHADHVQDLYPLALYRRYARRQLPVLGPPGTRALLERWFPLFSANAEEMLDALRVYEVAPGEALAGAGLELRPFAVEHNTPAAYGYVVHETGSDRHVVLSGDTRPCAALEAAAKGADLLVCEATFAGLGGEGARAHHTTAAAAGALARRAGVRRLVLTHLLMTTDVEQARREAESTFGAAVDVARPGDVWEVPR